MRPAPRLRTLFASHRPVFIRARVIQAFSIAFITVHNSLKPGGPVPFMPREEGKISWYACGPTVYNSSHLGHVRNYMSTDIIRHILIHHFGFKVNFVMNYTDVDNKIIIRTRRRRLLKLEKEKPYTAKELRDLVSKAFSGG